MRIGIDATALPDQPVGAGNYIIQLIRALAQLPEPAEYLIFAQSHGQKLIGELPNLRYQIVPTMSPAVRLVWEQVKFPRLVKQSNVDLLHSLHYTMPLSKPVSQVVTLHDMTYFLYPQYHTLPKRYFFRNFIRLSGHRADALLTYSKSTYHDATRLAGIPAKKMTNAPLGVTSDFRPIHDQQRLQVIKSKYNLPESFILFVSLLEPRKNVITLLHAYKELLSHTDSHKLVIVGRKGWMYTRMLELLDELGLRENVHFTGYVDQKDMPGMYNLADVFVYPSFYEGFGLPVLESMACGTPVITSNVSSMPEITGNAGVLIQPSDRSGLCSALLELIQNPALRQDLTQRGLNRAAEFTWNRTAEITMQVYRQVLASK